MMTRMYLLLLAIGLPALSGFSGQPGATPQAHSTRTFRITDLGTLSGGFDAEAFGVSGSGFVVGASGGTVRVDSKRTLTTVAFLWHQRHMMALGVPRGAEASFGYAVNARGTAAGAIKKGAKLLPATWKSGRGWSMLPVARATSGSATGVTASGSVSGTLKRIGAVSWRPERLGYSLHPLPGGKGGVAGAIDTRGDVAGTTHSGHPVVWPANGGMIVLSHRSHSQVSAIVSLPHGRFLVAGDSPQAHGKSAATLWKLTRKRNAWRVSRATVLAAPAGYGRTLAYSVNTNGAVVGVALHQTTYAACLWKNGRATLLTKQISSGRRWNLTWAAGVNGHGDIVGWGDHKGQERPYLLSPRS